MHQLIKDTQLNGSHGMPTASQKYVAIRDGEIVYLFIIYRGNALSCVKNKVS